VCCCVTLHIWWIMWDFYKGAFCRHIALHHILVRKQNNNINKQMSSHGVAKRTVINDGFPLITPRRLARIYIHKHKKTNTRTQTHTQIHAWRYNTYCCRRNAGRLGAIFHWLHCDGLTPTLHSDHEYL
jgi:hypothetical protein